MEDSTYNGWKNYETWAVGLYLDGNYTGHGTYLYVTELVQGWIKEERQRWSIADGLEAFVTEDISYDAERDEHTPNPLVADLLGASLSRVDWSELAEAWITNLTEENAA